MLFTVAALAAFLFGFAGAVSTSDQGGGLDPDGKPRTAAFAGCGMDPDGCRHTAAVTAASDQGMGTDPDGKPAR